MYEESLRYLALVANIPYEEHFPHFDRAEIGVKDKQLSIVFQCSRPSLRAARIRKKLFIRERLLRGYRRDDKL